MLIIDIYCVVNLKRNDRNRDVQFSLNIYFGNRYVIDVIKRSKNVDRLYMAILFEIIRMF